MNLFVTLASIISAGTDVTIVIRKNTDGRMVVSTAARNTEVKDSAKDIIPPFVVSGTPDELDAEFVQIITEPVSKATGLQTSMKAFEASMATAAAKSKAVDEEKKTKKLNYDKAMAEGKKQEDAKNYEEAVKSYGKALENATPADASKAKAAIDRCRKNQQPDIFAMSFDDEEPKAPEESEGAEAGTAEEPAGDPAEESGKTVPDPLAFGEEND